MLEVTATIGISDPLLSATASQGIWIMYLLKQPPIVQLALLHQVKKL